MRFSYVMGSKFLYKLQLPKIIVVSFLLILISLEAVPSYLSGKWPWADTPKVAAIQQLRNIRKTGLSLPKWNTVSHQTASIGGRNWLVQEIKPQSATQQAELDELPVLLLFLPQENNTHQPQLEWMDINGYQRWKTDSYRRLWLTVRPPDSSAGSMQQQLTPANSALQTVVKAEADFFRTWNQRQTFAALQWYAWPGGGSPSPNHWFWADQIAQLQRSHLPWAAICLLIPIDPLGDIEKFRSLAESLGQTVQATLMAGPLQS